MKFTCIALFVAVLVASVSAGGSSDQAVNDVGNEGRVGGLVNNFFEGGKFSDNSVKNGVSQTD